MGRHRVRISFRDTLHALLIAGLMHAFAALPARAEVDRQQLTLPDARLSVALVRSTLVSLNEANLTANYSVLRAASAPDFQRLYSEEKLSAIFSDLRTKHVDLAAAAMRDLVITDATYIPARKAVLLKGTVAAAPDMLRFETNFRFAYQFVDGRWRLFRLEIGISPAEQEPLQTVGTAL